MKIKVLRQKFFITLVILLICIGGTYFIVKIHIDHNKKNINEIDALNNKNEKLKKDIQTLQRGSSYKDFINLLKNNNDPHNIFDQITKKEDFADFLNNIAQDFRIDDTKINVGKFEILDVFTLYDWKIEYTKSEVSIQINAFLEEQILFFIQKLTDLLIKDEKLYNIKIKNISINHNKDSLQEQDVQKTDKDGSISFDFYFFNVIGNN